MDSKKNVKLLDITIENIQQGFYLFFVIKICNRIHK